MILNDLLHKFIDKATVSICIRFGSCVAATGGHLHREHSVRIQSEVHVHCVSKNDTDVAPVSYTHLTLPTILRV